MEENNEVLGKINDTKDKDKKLKEKDKLKQLEKQLKDVEKIQKSFMLAEKTIQDQQEKIVRLTADFANAKKRNEEELAKYIKYDGEKVIRELLTIIDNFERAISMSNQDDSFISGFKMIYDNLIKTLNEQGVMEIKALDEAFDPTTMNAVMMESNPEKEKNIVLDVMQKGYIYKDKVIRVAMVKVNE